MTGESEERFVRRGRTSPRLWSYDYSDPGWYFVTICTKDRSCLFGEIVDGDVRLSDAGEIAQKCWKATPEHFENTKVDVFQIMPNHVHGIVEIKARREKNTHVNPVGTRHAVSLQGFRGEVFGKPRPGSLSTIIRSYKSAVTKDVHARGLLDHKPIWQSRFYEHIIRDDTDYFFVQRYIEINPLLWHTDADNPDTRHLSTEDLRQILRVKHDLQGYALERVIEHDVSYRKWRDGPTVSTQDPRL